LDFVHGDRFMKNVKNFIECEADHIGIGPTGLFCSQRNAQLWGILAMTHLISWIEEAEAREMVQSAMVDHTVGITQSQSFHLGSTIAKVTSWWHHNISRAVLPYIHHDSHASA
jgi:hypothetical protein